jgi:hypothetical protein
MADAIGARDPSLREKIKAMLQGDSKPGSVREHLARGIMGGDLPLVDMTPMGVVLAKDETERKLNAKNWGGAAMSAAGMIPAARLPAGALEGAADLLRTFAGDKEKVAQELMANGFKKAEAESAVHHAQSSLNETMYDESRLPKLDQVPANVRQEAENRQLSRGVPHAGPFQGYNMRKEGQHSIIEGIGPYGGEFLVKSPGENLRFGNRQSALDHFENNVSATQPDRGATSVGEDLSEIAGGDPHKLNFIKNAMDDEGGNVPEDVAMTLLDHAKQRGTLDEWRKEYNISKHEDPQALVDALVESHSIPEMLSMHYDLDPNRFKDVYKAKPKSRPTQ